MTTDIIMPQQEYLPPELLLDPYHPSTSDYMQALKGIQQLIVSASVNMMPWHVTAVKAKVRGSTNVDVGLMVGKTAVTIGKALRRADVQELRALLLHYNQAVDGPNEAQRRRMLWEMAIDYKDVEPNVTLKSIAELNKMSHVYTTGKADTAINIVINNKILPKGALDQ
jgi:hypothetical protein